MNDANTAAPDRVSEARAEKLRNNLIDPKEVPLRDVQKMLAANPATAIFVMNRSDKGNSRPRGQVMITLNDQGETSTLRVPKTFVPIEVTNLYPASVLLRSSNFLQNVNSKSITLHDPDECLLYLQNQDAQEELERIRTADSKYGEEMDKEMIQISTDVQPKGEDDEIKVTSDDESKPKKKSKSSVRIESKDQVNGDESAINVLWRVYTVLNDKSISSDRQLAALRNISEKFRSIDYKYVLSKTSNERVIDWAKMNLTELRKKD